MAQGVGDEIEGFRVTAITEVPDVGGRLWQMTYVTNGAELVWMDRPDDNLTFAIAFKTIPEDDTGIAHIMEHSVLCGSAKYHLKEPFIDLSKSSLATFLNAFTSADHTVYPIASRNRQDYLNLADVYLDAVFHPLSVNGEWQLRQEGWRYEDDGTSLTRNGIVYSEMKGVYGSPFRVADLELKRLLYPDNTYGKSSGGDPVHIPELTHAQYRRFHEKFYHPCNALVFLDGKVDLKATLALVGSYLKDFPKRSVDRTVPLQKPVRGSRTCEYESNAEKNLTIVLDGRVYGTHEDRERELAMDVICRYLTGSNEAPLKKAVLDSKLCQDFAIYTSGYEQMALCTLARNVVTGRADELRALVRETIRRLCREGFDRAQLSAILDRREFVARERDSDQRGLQNLSAVLDSWLYGGHPAAKLGYREVFAKVRSRLGTGWFEQILKTAFDSDHCGEVTLVPSTTVAERRRQAEQRELAAIRAKMTSEELKKIGEMSRWLKRHQTEPDSAEEIAKLPRLSLRDLPAHGNVPAWSVSDVEGTPLIRPQVALDGIVYLDLCFSLKGLTDEELLDTPFLAEMLGQLATTRHTALQVKSELDGRLGGFWLSPESYASGPQLTVHFSALNTRTDDVLRLAEEILLGTRFDDGEAIACLRAQEREDLEQSMSSSGRGYAETRAKRSLSERNRISELFGGISQLRRLQGPKTSDWKSLAKKIFVRNRLTICLTGDLDNDFVRRTVRLFPQAEIGTAAAPTTVAGPTSEGFVADGSVGYLTLANRLPSDVPFHGSQLVAAKIISMEHLWIEVRMKGGAYGGRLEISPLGDVTCSSWRDPSPERSLGVCSSVADALTGFLDSGAPFERYQVAMTRACEPNLSPRGLSSFARQMHFNGRTSESLQRTRREVIETTTDDLRKFSGTLRTLMSKASTCVFANGKLLENCKLKKVEGIRQSPQIYR